MKITEINDVSSQIYLQESASVKVDIQIEGSADENFQFDLIKINATSAAERKIREFLTEGIKKHFPDFSITPGWDCNFTVFGVECTMTPSNSRYSIEGKIGSKSTGSCKTIRTFISKITKLAIEEIKIKYENDLKSGDGKKIIDLQRELMKHDLDLEIVKKGAKKLAIIKHENSDKVLLKIEIPN